MDTNRSTFEGNLIDCRLDGAHCAMQSNTTIAITDIQARPVSLVESCLPLSNMEAMSIRGISLGFECSEYGHSKHDAHHKKGGIGHIWPIRDGSDACHDISERNGGVLYIKAIGGHINWNASGRKDMVRAYHQDHYVSIYDPILRDLNYFPGPAMWHAAPERVSDYLRDAVGERGHPLWWVESQ